MLKIRYLSDLHLIHCPPWEPVSLAVTLVATWVPYQTGDNQSLLVIAGDIEPIEGEVFVHMLNILCSRFKHVLVVPGNHDFRTMPLYPTNSFVKALESKGCIWPNLHFANGVTAKTFDIEGVKIIATTLWADMGEPGSKEEQIISRLPDFRSMRTTSLAKANPDLLINELRLIHQWAKSDIEEQLNTLKEGQRAVVVTHFLPSTQVQDLRYSPSPIDRFFAGVGMDEFLAKNSSKISHWVFGHTHRSVQKTLWQTELLCNPVGYPGEHSTYFDPNASFEVPSPGVRQDEGPKGTVEAVHVGPPDDGSQTSV